MDAYIELTNLSNVVSLDPAHADLTQLNRYLTGKAKTLFDSNFAAMKRAGEAYKGTPANPRVKVQSVAGSSLVLLTSCPLASKSDPFIEYYVKTGKPVQVATRTPPPPYRLILTMVRTAGHWQLSDLISEAGKTCVA